MSDGRRDDIGEMSAFLRANQERHSAQPVRTKTFPTPTATLEVAISSIEDDNVREAAAQAVASLIEQQTKLVAALRFVRQTVHQAHHEGPIEACSKNTCDAVSQVLGERVYREGI